ncbi:MAG: class I SAM-dependent methyltransferase [Vibrio sp.]
MKVQALDEFFAQLNQKLANISPDLQRLFHGRGRCFDGLEQITADWLGQHLVVSLFKPVDDAFLSQLKLGLNQISQTPLWQQAQGKSIGLAHRYEHGAPYETLCGEHQTQVIGQENGLSYELRLGVAQNAGLFLDMANGRHWVKAHAQDKRVLNLFAYTCGFSVAAIAGGASHVVNVDMAKSALSRGRDNHRHNGHDLRDVTFMGHDILKSWGKITKAGGYDLIVIDPPSFQKGSFALTKDYQKILRRLPQLMNPNAQVLACVNSPAVNQDFLVQAMAEQAPELTFIERLQNPAVFSDIDEQASLKALVFQS